MGERRNAALHVFYGNENAAHAMAIQRTVLKAPTRKVILIDPDEVMRSSYRILIDSSPSFEIVGEFSSPEECIGFIRKRRPDIIIAEVELPGMGGIELTKWARVNAPWAEVIILSDNVDKSIIFHALKAGACGYLSKHSPYLETMTNLSEILRNGAPLSPAISRTIIESFRINHGSDLLSRREVEVIELLAVGRTYKEIAADLQMSSETVKTHLKNIYKKLSVSKKSDAIAKARSLKFI